MNLLAIFLAVGLVGPTLQAQSVEARFSRDLQGRLVPCNSRHKGLNCLGAQRVPAALPSDLFGPIKKQSPRFGGGAKARTSMTSTQNSAASMGLSTGGLVRPPVDRLPVATSRASKSGASAGRADVFARLTPERVSRLEYWQHVRYIKLMRKRMLVLDKINRRHQKLVQQGAFKSASKNIKRVPAAEASDTKRTTVDDSVNKTASRVASIQSIPNLTTEQTKKLRRYFPAPSPPLRASAAPVSRSIAQSSVSTEPGDEDDKNLREVNFAVEGFHATSAKHFNCAEGVGAMRSGNEGDSKVGNACLDCTTSQDVVGYRCGYALTGMALNQDACQPILDTNGDGKRNRDDLATYPATHICAQKSEELSKAKKDNIEKRIGKCKEIKNNNDSSKTLECSEGEKFFKHLRNDELNKKNKLITMTEDGEMKLKNEKRVEWMFEHAYDPKVKSYLIKYLEALEEHSCGKSVVDSKVDVDDKTYPCATEAQELIRKLLNENDDLSGFGELFFHTIMNQTELNELKSTTEDACQNDSSSNPYCSFCKSINWECGKLTCPKTMNPGWCKLNLHESLPMSRSITNRMKGAEGEANCEKKLSPDEICKWSDPANFGLTSENQENDLGEYKECLKDFGEKYIPTSLNPITLKESFQNNIPLINEVRERLTCKGSHLESTPDEIVKSEYESRNICAAPYYKKIAPVFVNNLIKTAGELREKDKIDQIHTETVQNAAGKKVQVSSHIRYGDIFAKSLCRQLAEFKLVAEKIDASGSLGCVPPIQDDDTYKTETKGDGRESELKLTGAAACVACAAERAMINADNNDYEVSSKWLNLMSTMANVCEGWGYNGAPILQKKYIEVFGHCEEVDYNFEGGDSKARYQVSSAVVKCKNKNDEDEKQKCLQENQELQQNFLTTYGLSLSEAKNLFSCGKGVDDFENACGDNCSDECNTNDKKKLYCVDKHRRANFNQHVDKNSAKKFVTDLDEIKTQLLETESKSSASASTHTSANRVNRLPAALLSVNSARTPASSSKYLDDNWWETNKNDVKTQRAALNVCLAKAKEVQQEAYTNKTDLVEKSDRKAACVKWVKASDCDDELTCPSSTSGSPVTSLHPGAKAGGASASTQQVAKVINLLRASHRVSRQPAQTNNMCTQGDLKKAFEAAKKKSGAMMLTHGTMCRVAHSTTGNEEPKKINFDYRDELKSTDDRKQRQLVWDGKGVQGGGGQGTCSADFTISLIGPEYCAVDEPTNNGILELQRKALEATPSAR